MTELVRTVQNAVEAVIFGNGWLALAGLAVVVLSTAAIRLGSGIRV